jgi:CRISPR system Cascade subunit CasE
VFYVLSEQCPHHQRDLWTVDTKHFAPDIRASDCLAFKLRVNPTVARGIPGTGRGRRHDVVMDAKRRMGWKDLPETGRPSLAHLAYEAGACWLRERQDRLGVKLNDTGLRVDGYHTWRQRTGRGIALSTLDYEGELTVVDPDRFLNALFNGIGPAKAFGCGLLLLRRLG